MANTKISALTALTGANLATNDQFAVVDTSAVATKSITVAELKLGIMPAPGPIGGTTPSTGAFTTLSATTGAAVGGATAGTGGLAFPATAVAVADANTLDDYEEGVAPVTLTCGTSGTITLNGSPFERLAYTKVGRKVTLLGLLTVASVSSPVGTLNISGLPFTIGSSASLAAEGGASITSAIATQTAAIAPIYGAASSTVATIFTRFASGSRSSNAADIQAGTELYINFTYFI